MKSARKVKSVPRETDDDRKRQKRSTPTSHPTRKILTTHARKGVKRKIIKTN